MSDYEDDIEIDDVEFDNSNSDDMDLSGSDLGEDDEDDGLLMENTYYNAKAEEDEDEALESFQTLLDMEEEKGDWGFKALKQMIKRLFKAGRFDEMQEKYQELLDRMGPNGHVSRNESEKAINKVLNLVSNGSDEGLLDKVYSISLSALKKMSNEQLWFNTKLKLGNHYIEKKTTGPLGILIQELMDWCHGEDGKVDSKKSSQLLDCYVLHIQMAEMMGDLKLLRALYLKCKEIIAGAVVMNSGNFGIVRECGAKMYMRQNNWKAAYGDFFEAFKSYDEAGNIKRIDCLKYLVLSAMLMSNESNEIMNPFEAPEAKPYRSHKDIEAMTSLVQAYEQSDIRRFERTIKTNRAAIMEDEFMAAYIQDLMNNIRTRVILKEVPPYTRIFLNRLANELNVSKDVIEGLIVELILDRRLDGHIDQMKGILVLGNNRNESVMLRQQVLDEWGGSLQKLHQHVLSKIS